MARPKLIALVLLIGLLLVGCGNEYVSEEPTTYHGLRTVGSQTVTVYFTEEHPDVKAAVELLESFLRHTQTQVWEHLDFTAAAGSFARANTYDSWVRQMTSRYERNQLSQQLQSTKIVRISFDLAGNDAAERATAQIDVVIRYTACGTDWLGQREWELGADHIVTFDLNLEKISAANGDERWGITSITDGLGS